MKNYIKLIHVARRATFECPVCGRISCLGRDSPTVCSSCKSMMVALGSVSYRGVLRTLTGKESTKDMDEDELEKVYTFFCQAGFCPTRGADAVEREYETGRRKTQPACPLPVSSPPSRKRFLWRKPEMLRLASGKI